MLPVHVFQKTEDGWRERLVDVAIEDDEEEGSSTGGDTDEMNKDHVKVKLIDGINLFLD